MRSAMFLFLVAIFLALVVATGCVSPESDRGGTCPPCMERGPGGHCAPVSAPGCSLSSGGAVEAGSQPPGLTDVAASGADAGVDDGCDPRLAGARINEVLFDLPGVDEGLEFIELRLEPGLDVGGLTLTHVNGSNGDTIFGPIALAGRADQFGIFVLASGSVPADQYEDFELQNGPDSLALGGCDGAIIDALAWGDFGESPHRAGTGPAADPPGAGLSLARCPGSDAADSGAEFGAATPGAGHENTAGDFAAGECPGPPGPQDADAGVSDQPDVVEDTARDTFADSGDSADSLDAAPGDTGGPGQDAIAAPELPADTEPDAPLDAPAGPETGDDLGHDLGHDLGDDAGVACLPWPAGAALTRVLFDPPGADGAGNFEVVVLSGPPGEVVSGLSVEFINGTDGQPYHPALVLDGVRFSEAGDLILAGAGIGRDLPLPGPIQNGPDGLVLRGCDGAVLDSVFYGGAPPDGTDLTEAPGCGEAHALIRLDGLWVCEE